MMNRSCFLLLTLFLFPFILSATTYSSNGSGGGAWGAPATWSPAGPPVCGDTITILAGDLVTIEAQQDYSACGSPMFITISGTLDFPVNGPKLRLPCNSGIIVNPGGWITASGAGGGGNANFIEICGSVVWQKSDGDVSGPLVFGTPLPVELLSFTAEIDNTSVILTWITSSEINNDYFTIERSDNAVDFEALGDIPGSGNSNITKTYDFSDDSPIQGTSYYRLKQTDFDGKYEYFDLVAINFNKDQDGICTLHIYPNPCVGSCTINLEDCPLADNEVDVELYDALGKKISNRIKPKNKDRDISFHLNSSNNLSPGVYIVRSSTKGKIQASRVTIK